MVVFCVLMLIFFGGKRRVMVEGIEEIWMVNFFVNFYLLGIFSFVLCV